MIPHEQLERYLNIVREDINKRLKRLEEKVAALERIVGKFDEVKEEVKKE